MRSFCPRTRDTGATAPAAPRVTALEHTPKLPEAARRTRQTVRVVESGAKPALGSQRESVLLDWTHLPSAVEPARRTHLVRQLALVALRTFAQAHRRQRIMRATLGRACLRVATFGIRHTRVFLSKPGLPVHDVFGPPLGKRSRSASSRGSTQWRSQPQATALRFAPHSLHKP